MDYIKKEGDSTKRFRILAILFGAIRQSAIPNPFTPLGEGVAFWLNLAAEPFIVVFTYRVVGLHYMAGSEPAWGSILYMFFYCVHIGLIYLLSACYPQTWLIVLILLGYAAIHYLLITQPWHND